LVNIKDFLEGLKLNYRETSTHFQVDCPLCTDSRKRLGISKTLIEDKGKDYAWSCFNCSSKGLSLANFKKAIEKLKGLNRKEFVEYKSDKSVSIKQDLADKCHDLIKKNKTAVEYLINERRITKEAIKHFKLGYRTKFRSDKGDVYDAGPHIAIPYLEGEKLVNIKYRSIDPEVKKEFKWRREKGGKTALFNSDVTNDHDHHTIIIAESEIDTMSIWCAGFKNVVGLTAGAKAFEQEWYDRLERFDKVYLVLDNDTAGKDGAKAIAKRLGLGRCYNVQLPEDVKDPNDYFKKYSTKDFKELLRRARRFDIERVTSLAKSIRSEIKKIRFGEEKDQGISTGFSSIDHLMGLMQEGNYIVLCARPKVGKTRFLINILNRNANKGIHTFNVQCEMTERDLINSYVRLNTQEYLPDFSDVGTPDAMKEAKDQAIEALTDGLLEIPTFNLMSYHPNGNELDPKIICDKIRQVTQRFGTKIVGIDNMHFICRGNNAKEKIDEASQMFKSLAVELGIVLIVVTHPKKTNHNRELDNDDLKDSSSMFQDADAVLLLHRPKMDSEIEEAESEEDDSIEEGVLSPLTFVKITARRKTGGRCKLVYIPEYSIFKDTGYYYRETLDGYKKAIRED
jgi:replicative DNA helicase